VPSRELALERHGACLRYDPAPLSVVPRLKKTRGQERREGREDEFMSAMRFEAGGSPEQPLERSQTLPLAEPAPRAKSRAEVVVPPAPSAEADTLLPCAVAALPQRSGEER